MKGLLLKDNNPELILVNDMGRYSRDPNGFVLYAFKWGQGELEGYDGPDVWQTDQLKRIGDKLKANPYMTIREAIASGHGIGKGAESAWLILWAMSTCEDTRGIITANTETQLKTKSWAELAKWYRLCITRHWFTMTATAIYSVIPEHAKTWRIDMIPWSEDKPEAFAGLHNQGKRILLIFDEASSIANIIWEVAEGAMTDKDTEIIWCVYGNPTRNTGRFKDCFNRFRHRYNTAQIDSRTCKMTNKEELQNWIDDYGIDSDFCKIRVLGEFPNTSAQQYIPTNYVTDARYRKIGQAEFYFAAKIIGVDPDWSGDDSAAIYLRQGNHLKCLGVYKNIQDDYKMAGYIANFEDKEGADAVFIDYGYGTGIYSAGKQMGRNWILIPFGASSGKLGFRDKRSEMWGDMKKWLLEGGCIPDKATLCEELLSPEYEVITTGKHSGKTMIETSKAMKKRGIRSPNEASAAILTFAQPVVPKNQFQGKRVEGLYVPNQRQFANSGYKVL